MALLQNDKAVFYHPLDDAVEAAEAKTWAGSADFTDDGKVGRSMCCPAADPDASLAGLTADYGSAAGGVKVALAGWFCNPSSEDAGPPGASPEYAASPGPPSSYVNIVSAAALSSGEFVLVWQDSGTGDVRAIVGAVSGTAVSFGGARSIEAADAESVSAAALSQTAFLACYTDAASHDLSAVVGAVSGLDITLGAPSRRSSPAATSIQCVSLTPTLAVCTFRHSTGGASTVALTVSGTDITFGPAQEPGNGRSLCVAKLTSTTFIQIYRAESFGSRGRARVGTVTGGTVTFGSNAAFSENDNNHPIGEFGFVCALDSTHVVVVYVPSSGKSRAVVGFVSGETVSFAPWVSFGSSTPTKLKCEALDPTHFAVVTHEGGVLKARTAAVSGGDMILSTSKKANSGAQAGGWLNGQAVARLSAGKFVVVYAASGQAKAQVFTAASAAPAVDSPIGYHAEAAGGTGVNGSTIQVYVNGRSVGAADGPVSGGKWAKTGMAALSAGDMVKARQTEPGKPRSAPSNVVAVAEEPLERWWMGWSGDSTWLGGSPAAANPMSVCALDPTHAVVLWRDGDGNAKAIAGSIDYLSVAWGSAKTIGPAYAASVSVVALGSTKFLACYTSSGGGSICAVAGTVSGADITVGPIDTYVSTNVRRVQCAALAPGLAVCAWERVGFPRQYCASINVSGTVAYIVPGSVAYLNLVTSFGFVAGLTSTTFVLMYGDAAGGRAKVGIVGAPITWGTPAGFTANAIGDYGFVCALDSSRFVVAYEDAGDSGKGKVAVGTVSGTGVTFGAPCTFYSSAVTKVKCEALDSARFVVAAYDAGGEDLRTWIGTVGGTDVAFGFATGVVLAGERTGGGAWLGGQTMAKLDGPSPSGQAIVIYADSEDGNKGKSQIGEDHAA